YYFHDTHDPPDKDAHTANDPYAHRGKMDQVLLRSDGTLEARFYDLHNSPPSGFYYETREVTSMAYDHFQHPGNLYVGSNHGVTRIIPAKYYPPPHLDTDPFYTGDERQWYADHVHPVTCLRAPCTGDPIRDFITFGDWFGLALGPDGRLWMGGLASAGAIGFREKLDDWVKSWKPVNPFDPAFQSPPVFVPPGYGDPVNIRGVAVTQDGVVWFVSGEVERWRGPTYGIA